jgi:assimilatory nitrate reductase catalytic subunit
VLAALAPERLHVQISPADASDAGVAPGDEVMIESRRGAIRAVAQVTSTVASGQVFVPMHHHTTNVLTFPRVDPHSRQPAYKHAAVRVRPPHPWEQS